MNILLKKFVFLTVFTIWGLAACSDDCSCAPNGPANVAESSSGGMGAIQSSSDIRPSSSSIANPDTVVSSSSVVLESSSSIIRSSSANCLSMDTACGWTAEQLCEMGQKRYCLTQSSSSGALSSSSQMRSSSSVEFLERCMDFARMCPAYNGPYARESYRPCNECFEGEGVKAVDCRTGGVYTCSNRFWRMEGDQCLNVAYTKCEQGADSCGRQLCGSINPKTVIDCKSGDTYACTEGYWTLLKSSETCMHITDVDDPRERTCDVDDGSKAVDCITREEYACRRGYWVNVEPVIGEVCLVENEYHDARNAQLNGRFVGAIYLCSNGKWAEYEGDFSALQKCRMHPVNRTPCDENSPKEISSGECAFKCRNGEYVFVMPAVQ